MTLTFHVYFEESADAQGNNTDRARIRKCHIHYFLEDDTISIVEKPQVNSGIPQGKLVKRSVILRPDGFTFNLDDFGIAKREIMVRLFMKDAIEPVNKNFSCDSESKLAGASIDPFMLPV